MRSGPIWVGGLDRTGKTTLSAFLASHPSIAIPTVGSNMWTYFYARFGDLGRPANLDRCLDAMLRYKHVRFLQPDPERIRREFLEGPATYGRLFALFLAHYAEREGKARWGVQTGLIERYADQLVESYPGARIIHMVRDPRDRYEASLALWPGGRGRAGGATARWLYSMRLAERNLRRHPGSYLLVRYEDMVRETERTLRDVCAFVGEPFVPEMLAMTAASQRLKELMSRARPARRPGPLSTEFIGSFRGRVPRPELAFMQLHAGRRMRHYGYELDRLNLAPHEWARFAATSWPSNVARMLAWRGIEALQQRLPRMVQRKPHPRMVLAASTEGTR